MDTATKNYLYPKTAKEALDKWDSGTSIFTVEMGGMGPGYEQAIHIGVFEVIRKLHNKKLPDEKTHQKELQKIFDDSIPRGLGLSGAQAGAIKQVASKALILGWRKMMDSVPQDRKIQVSKNFPTLK
jgi:hypothetical protein